MTVPTRTLSREARVPTPAGIRPATQQQAAGRREEWGAGHARGHAQLGRCQQHKGHKTRCTRWTDLQAEVVKSRPSEICPVAASLGPLGLEFVQTTRAPCRESASLVTGAGSISLGPQLRAPQRSPGASHTPEGCQGVCSIWKGHVLAQGSGAEQAWTGGGWGPALLGLLRPSSPPAPPSSAG